MSFPQRRKTVNRSEEIDQAKVGMYPPCRRYGSTENERRADKRMKSGWSSNCRQCANEKSREWRESNLERQLATTKAWREANRDKVRDARLKHAEKERVAALEWRRNNLERARANDAAWRLNNPERARLKDQKRRASKMSATTGRPITQADIAAILKHQDGLCAYCAQPVGDDYHLDHFIALSKGGMHDADNIVVACQKCNLQKGAKSPLVFMEIKTPKKTTEAREQSMIVMWSHKKLVRDLMPDLRWLHHSPNGEKRDARTGNKLKAMGVKPGFPDLILPVRAGNAPGLVIEMKSETGSTSAPQKEWIAHFQAQGWEFRLARSAQEARTILCQYLGIPQESTPELDG